LFYPHRQVGKLPTPDMKACQHPWAECGPKSKPSNKVL
jgi:hypothetical protein